MGIGVALPASDDLGPNSVDYFLDRAGEAHDVGLGSVWFSQRFDHDALLVAAAVGAAPPPSKPPACTLASDPIAIDTTNTADPATLGTERAAAEYVAEKMTEVAKWATRSPMWNRAPGGAAM
jgi:hypothetical protein